MKIKIPLFTALSLLLLTSNAYVFANDDEYYISAGFDFSRGDYGMGDDISEYYYPVTIGMKTSSVGFSLTIPYLEIEAPEGTVVADSGQFLPGSGSTTTERGLGDVVVGITAFDVFGTSKKDIAVDVTARAKLGTGDEKKGLGTGENDYSLETSLYKFYDQFYLRGSVGYMIKGDPSFLAIENAWFGSIGGAYQFTNNVRGGVTYHFRQSALEKSDDIQEITGFISLPISDSWQTQLYASKGFSDSTPDWGWGALLKTSF